MGEIRLVQPVLMLRVGAWQDRLVLQGTVNFEGWTIPRGELTPGAWGEGFTDRRHPHTYVHELMLSANDLLGTLRWGHAGLAQPGQGLRPFRQ